MSDKPRHSVSVAAVVTDDENRVLVIQRRDNGDWEIPGGILELDESISEGLCREVKEETGLTIEPGQLTGVYKNIRLGVIALVFRAHVTGGQESLSEETAKVEWWTLEQIQEHMTEVFAIRVTDAFDTNTSTIRLHDGIHIIG